MSHGIYLFVDSLGWALLHSLWQGIVVWILFNLTHRSLVRSSPHVRHVNALLWLMMMLVLPIVTCVIAYCHTATSGPASTALLSAAVNNLSRGWFDSTSLSAVTNSFPVLVSLWFATLACLCLRTVMGWKKVKKLSSQGCYPIPQWQSSMQQLVVTMGVRAQVRLRESIHVHVPMVVGWLKPVVLVPSSALLGLTPRELELIIAHELAHIQRLDYVSNYVLVLAENLLFYHPAVYSITHVIRQERELCCDDLVIKNCGDRLHYVRALAKLETLRGQVQSGFSGLQLAATDGPLLLRIRRIVSGAQHSSTSGLAAGIIALGTLGIASMSAWLLMKESHSLSSLEPAPITRTYAPEIARSFDPRFHSDGVFAGEFSGVYQRTHRPQDALEKSLDCVEDALIAKRQNDESFRKIRAEMQRHLKSDYPIIALTYEYAVPDMTWQGAEQVSVDQGLELDQFDARALIPKSEVHAAVVRQARATQFDRFETASTTINIADQKALQDPENLMSAMALATENSYDRKNDVEGGALIRQVQPRYPMHARLRGKEGSVQVEMHVDRSGKVTHAKVVSQDSNPLFERSVLRAVSQWSFEPMLRDGEPIERTVKRLFDFRFAS